MAADPPNSSWHPALMPDHESAPTTPPLKPTEDPSPDASPDSLHNGTPLEPEFGSDALDFTADDAGDGDAWFNNQGDEGGAWLASQPAAQDATAANAFIPTTDESSAPVEKSPSKAQHSSSMSFARTVSHEVSFGDDDEGDWSLPRTDTDPFKFMPPSDRTNSFPVPPPQTSAAESYDEQPLPSNQALDVLEETESDWNLHEASESHDRPDTAKGPSDAAVEQPRGRHGHSRSMGGDLQPFEEQADTRFEEGVPLMHQDNGTSNETQFEQKTGADPFGDDDGNDDFFGQVGEDEKSNNPPVPPLERKSTSQVLNNLDSEPPTRQNTFDTVREEDEFPKTDGGAARASKAPGRAGGHRRTKTQEINAKWQEAFGGDDDDDDFLLDSSAEDNDLDATGFLGSDDEGLLDDTDDAVPAAQAQPAQPPQPSRQSSSNPYAPQTAYQPSSAPIQTPTQPGSYFNPPAPTNTLSSAPQYGRPPLPGAQSDQPKAQSFADKNKGGYASPYDLPSDIVSSVPKPRKRPSTQSLYAPGAAAQQAPPPQGPPTSDSRPPSSDSQGPPGVGTKTSAPTLRNKGSFFEELPMSSKPRSASRQSNRAPSPAQHPPQGPPQAPPQGPPQGMPQGPALGPSPLGPGMGSQGTQPPPTQPEPSPQPNAYGNLVAPERVSPYATLQTGAPMPQPSGNATRYSPAPGQTQGSNSAPPPPAGNRYSPAPPPSAPRQSSYSPSRTSATSPSVLAHQPRTSSPLAHFESSNARGHGDLPLPERRSSSSSYEPRLNRMPSLPPTREVDEEEDQTGAGVSLGTRHSSAESKYAPMPGSRQTPPPPSSQAAFSPPKRTTSNYAPQPAPTAQPGFVPPPRAQTQSPGATKPTRPTHGHARRPSSAHSHAAPEVSKSTQSAYAPHSRQRGASISMNMVPPTDGREQDPLQRWKGVPILAWGVGGTVITTFPQSTPRYTISSSTPTITRTNGEVKVRNIKEIDPLPEHLAKFPGPLKGKSKKKETVAWLTAGITGLEKDLPDLSFHAELSLEAKRSIERLLLWKILRVFIEHDGTLEGTPAVEKAVRAVLSPEVSESGGPSLPGSSHGVPLTSMQADTVDAGTMDQIRGSLIKGEREAAVWTAVDKRLWGHAMLIANTVSPDLYKQVAQEFVRKEVNYQGHNNESMAALYKILSGNYEDCVDELVPSHARAGFQLVSTGPSTGPTKGAMDGLDKWRETLSLVLSNRSPGDVNGLNALGKLLASYGRAEAAHICFIFSRAVSVFGGINDPNANFVLVGSDHQQQTSHFGKETEALELSEVYEYGLTLAGGVAAASGSPHLAAYKLQHAVTLAEYGHRDKALQYCDAIASAMASQTKRSPYYNGYLAASVDDFITRLKQAPKGESGSWISKPSMGKVSDSMWNKFNKFVSGDDEGPNGPGGVNPDGSPFHQVGTTPTISRSPSVNNFEMYGSSGPSYGMPTPAVPAAPAAAPSKYAPGPAAASTPNPYQPTPQYTPVGGAAPDGQSEYPGFGGSAPEPSYPGAAPAQSNPYAPTAGYQPSEPRTSSDSHRPQGLTQSASMPVVSTGQPQGSPGYQPQSYGYEPPQMNYEAPEPTNETIEESQGGGFSGGFEPPSLQPYGYEPPSYEAPPPADDEEEDTPKPKKKSFMDDDEDDINPLRPEGKSKSEKDRENEELFRKAAEEDGKVECILILTRIANNFQPSALKKRRPARRAGASAPGLAARSLLHPNPARSPTSPFEPTSARPVPSFTTPSSSAGSTRSLAPRTLLPRQLLLLPPRLVPDR